MTAAKTFLDRVLAAVCITLFAALVLVVAWQVFTRQVLDAPSGWSEELAKYLFVWLSLLGAALVFGERGHIAVDIVANRLPRRPRRAVGVGVQVAVGGFAALVLVFGGATLAANTWGIAVAGLPATVGPLYTVLPLSGVLIVFYSVYHLVSVATSAERAVDDGEPTV